MFRLKVKLWVVVVAVLREDGGRFFVLPVEGPWDVVGVSLDDFFDVVGGAS